MVAARQNVEYTGQATIMSDDEYKRGYDNGKRDADADWFKSILKWIVSVFTAIGAGAVALISNGWSKLP